MKIKIEPYSDHWELNYEKLKCVYIDKLKGLSVDIQHVGSTSVKGLAAKPIIDIDIIIENSELLNPVTKELIELGYSYQGNLGITGRYAFSKSHPFVPFKEDESEVIDHNLYVCELNCIALENHLQFRDYLRKHPKAVLEYASLKYNIAASTQDIKVYVAEKTAFITKILEHCGMPLSAIELIKDSNNLR